MERQWSPTFSWFWICKAIPNAGRKRPTGSSELDWNRNGNLVPFLLLGEEGKGHVGTRDIDLALDGGRISWFFLKISG